MTHTKKEKKRKENMRSTTTSMAKKVLRILVLLVVLDNGELLLSRGLEVVAGVIVGQLQHALEQRPVFVVVIFIVADVV
jgi:hypothetical protein